MKRAITLILLLALVGCAHSDPWTKRDTVLQLVTTAAIACDAWSTTKIQYYPGISEGGPIARKFLGDQPSTSGTYQYMATAAISSYLISRALPAKWRPFWQVVHAYDHGSACSSNISVMNL